jgi:hypothetical protein
MPVITGHHIVAVFDYDGDETHLPPGWKPYSNLVSNGVNKIVARKWVRDSTVDAVAWAEATTKEAASVRS